MKITKTIIKEYDGIQWKENNFNDVLAFFGEYDMGLTLRNAKVRDEYLVFPHPRHGWWEELPKGQWLVHCLDADRTTAEHLFTCTTDQLFSEFKVTR